MKHPPPRDPSRFIPVSNPLVKKCFKPRFKPWFHGGYLATRFWDPFQTCLRGLFQAVFHEVGSSVLTIDSARLLLPASALTAEGGLTYLARVLFTGGTSSSALQAFLSHLEGPGSRSGLPFASHAHYVGSRWHECSKVIPIWRGLWELELRLRFPRGGRVSYPFQTVLALFQTLRC